MRWRIIYQKLKRGRWIHRYHNQEWRDRYRARIQTRAVKALINQRKTIVEHPFGTIRAWMGKTQFLLRGRPKVQIVSFTDLKEMIEGYDWEMA